MACEVIFFTLSEEMEAKASGRTEGSTKRKHKVTRSTSRAAKMNAVLARKHAKVDDSVETRTDEQRRGDSDPGPSGPLSEEDPPSESESENERGDGHTSDEESEFDNVKARELLDDWVEGLPRLDKKYLSVLLFQCFRNRHRMSICDAAVEAAYIAGVNERTIRGYKKEFFENKGSFKESRQGKHKRDCLLQNLRLEASMWVRANTYKKGAANMTASSFCYWVNNDLLPSHNLPPNLPRKISVRSATHWLHKLGFRPRFHKKETYVDGHEREDVVKSRVEFLDALKELKETHLPPPPCSDEPAALPPADAETRKTLLLIYHDESMFNINDTQTWLWAADDMPVIQPKTKGSGIMVSDFIDQHDAFLQLADEQHAVAKQSDADFPKTARALLEYGAEREGYWTGEKFMVNIANAAKIADFKYNKEKHKIVWLFDQSSCHKAFAEDALNANKMNFRPGGAQLAMRDTVWAGQQQKMVKPDGTPKGMKAILEERGIHTETLKADDMRMILKISERRRRWWKRF